MITLYQNDIPSDVELGTEVAIDTEPTGLDIARDRLCLIQLSAGDGNAHLVKFPTRPDYAPNLCRILSDNKIHKIFHYGRFDMAMIQSHFGISCQNIFDTKIASKLCRPETSKHSLKDLTKDILGIHLDKSYQQSDWSAEVLSDAQLEYAASDVLYLHQLKEKLTEILIQKNMFPLAKVCFQFLSTQVSIDLLRKQETDIFSHH